MDAADLRVFEAVARFGGMNKAALELNTVQSNVTRGSKPSKISWAWRSSSGPDGRYLIYALCRRRWRR
jgi:hypothetical protein